MVYKKERSGDPDYDDKQPPEFHAGQVVTAGDGVYITPQGGAVDAQGAHVNLAGSTEDGDNRPTPGNVAKHSSTVQDYQEEDTPAGTDAVEADKADVEAIRAGQASVIAAGQAMANGTVDTDKQADETHSDAGTSTPPRESTSGSKSSTTTSTTKSTTK
jgi:hypothetical protein